MRPRGCWWLASVMALLAVTGLGILVSQASSPAASVPPADSETKAPTYAGSDLCSVCHRPVREDLGKTGHAAVLADPGLPEDLRGCESCHGPGSNHIGTTGKESIGETFAETASDAVEAICGKCHLQGTGSGSPDAWRRLDSRHWSGSLHARGDVSCLDCHRIHGGSERSLKQPASELCLGCHEDVVDADGGYTHQPVAQGQCLLCHDPHGGAKRHNVVDNIGAACLSCHSDKAAGFAAAHSGYAVGGSDCTSCHSPHSFDRAKHLLGKNQHQPFATGNCVLCHVASDGGSEARLSRPQQDLCLMCHPRDTIMPAHDAEGRELIQHAPVQQGLCTTCHNPHATDHPKHMKDEVELICFLCHGGTEDATLSPREHVPVATGNCLLCHDGHAAVEKHLLNKGPIELCEGCHATQGSFTHPVGAKRGKVVRNPNTGDMMVCADCHAVHGSDFEYLLPQEEMALCRTCHSK